MNRREKVKDLVEVRSITNLRDFGSDPGLTIESYHFTDGTADLMGHWIDRIAELKPGRGSAFALAGLRGVGKSHFLAVLAALASCPDERSQIKDPHILSRLKKLPKRPLPVAVVKRGSGDTLMSELRAALSETFAVNPKELTDSLNDLLLKAFELANESPMIIFIDTSFGREARVERDDGRLLSEVADAAKHIGILVGIALDDDVSGADGPNSSIARAYHIDFLDQEHLYKIVDRHIFPKNDAMLPVLKDIYLRYQVGIPGFKWSEQRFVPLYPLHPATLEISPLVRLFVQDFALLGFASEAGAKIMGRPADSLIGLDEMFRKVESNLRKAPQLESAFKHFDKLNTEVIQKSSVEFRLKARLILVGLFLLSLDGQGASAATIAASMMIFDEQDPHGGLKQVENILNQFANEVPNAVATIDDTEAAVKFCFRIGIDDGLEKAIEHRRSDVSFDDIWSVLLNQISERFPEIRGSENHLERTSNVTVEWRGSMRRGEIGWNSIAAEPRADHSDLLDWSIRLKRPGSTIEERPLSFDCLLLWEIAQLSPEEVDAVTRYFILRSHPDLRQKFGEDASVTAHLLSASVDKICQRVFFDDAFISLGDLRFPMQRLVETTHNLAHLFTNALMPVFDHLYSAHPYFLQSLGFKEVSHLTVNFFGRSDIFNPQTQNLVQLLVEPLELAERTPDGYIPASADSLNRLAIIQEAFEGWSGDGTLELQLLASRFKSSPMGLTREAQQLMLTALVAQREIDFVTTTGNRINYRSLDLQIIWDDVVGIARPIGEKYTDSDLISWLRILTGDDEIISLDEGRFKINIDNGLHKWQAEWRNGKILEDYEGLEDQSLNASSWRTAAGIRKSLGSVAGMVQSYDLGNVSIQECLESVADLFLGSESEFHKKWKDLGALHAFTNQAKDFEMVRRYVSLAEMTDDSFVERSRRNLLALLEEPLSPSGSQATLFAWEQFHDSYKSFYAEKHRDFVTIDRPAALRQLTESMEWQQFEIYCALSVFDQRTKASIEDLLREFRDPACSNSGEEFLDQHPYCFCGVRLKDMKRIARIPAEIRSMIAEGISSTRKKMDEGGSAQTASGSLDRILMTSASLAGLKV